MNDFRHPPEATVLFLNKRAMEKLNQNLHKEAFDCLRKAENLLKANDLDDQVWAITMNNFGCYYKKKGKLQKALSCLKLALSKGTNTINDLVNIAVTHLNISSIYSSLSIHSTALYHSQTALKLLQITSDRSTHTITTLISAYHTVGLSLESLSRHSEALTMYKSGWELAHTTLNTSHPLSTVLKPTFSQSDQVPFCRIPAQRPKPSKKIASNRKSPIFQPRNENFPFINVRNPSTSYSATKEIQEIRSEAKKLKNNLPVMRGKGFKTINTQKIKNLQNIIEEVEESFKGQSWVKSRVNGYSVGVQVGSLGVNKMDSVQNDWKSKRKMRKEDFDVEIAEIEVKEAFRQLEKLKMKRI